MKELEGKREREREKEIKGKKDLVWKNERIEIIYIWMQNKLVKKILADIFA